MNPVASALETLPGFLLYFSSATLLCFLFLAIYIRTTPHKELELIRNGNSTAAIKLGGALIGFTLPVASVIAHSLSLIDMSVWGLVALTVQILGYQLMRVAIPSLSQAVMDNKHSAGILAAAVAIALGIINAACLTY
jgi:putative membrane protein